MRYSYFYPIMIFIGLLFFNACTPSSRDVQPSKELKAEVESTTQAQPGELRQSEWEEVLAKARKEGKVVVLAGGSNIRDPISREFKNKYGINVEFIIGRGDEQVRRVLSERRNGIYANDVYLSSPSMMIIDLKPAGALVPLEPALILPEVKDTKYWQGEKLPWLDKEHYILQFIAYVLQPLGINTNLVSQGEIKSYRDLLATKWKERMTINDPTTSGIGNQWFIVMLSSGKLDIDFMRQLVAQRPVIMRDQRLQLLWLAQGKYPIAIAPKSDELEAFKKEGAPVKEVTPKEGTYVSSGGGSLSMFDKAPHPNAARVFINWVLTREGVNIYSKARGGEPSVRIDVPTDYVEPNRIPQPGIEYFRPTPEYYLTDSIKFTNVAIELFKPLME